MKKTYMLVFVLLMTATLLFGGCAGGGGVTELVTPAPSSSAPANDSAAPSGTASAGERATASPVPTSSATADDGLVLTLDELAKYNGKDGNPAYIAVDGVIYDVTGDGQWKNGEHKGYYAGTDLTDAMKNSPHGLSKLEGLPVVGKLAD